jgi:hypothetical protein
MYQLLMYEIPHDLPIPRFRDRIIEVLLHSPCSGKRHGCRIGGKWIIGGMALEGRNRGGKGCRRRRLTVRITLLSWKDEGRFWVEMMGLEHALLMERNLGVQVVLGRCESVLILERNGMIPKR